MPESTIVVDYGVGNIFSIINAFKRFSEDVELSDDPGRVAAAKRLVLPGVGAFRDGMQGLAKRGLVDPIREYVAKGRPFLGICLGMQMMLDKSDEFGEYEGLGLIPGSVEAIPRQGLHGDEHKVPHIGWSDIEPVHGEDSWRGTILDSIPVKTEVYFVHSFTAAPNDERHRLADVYYNSIRLSAVIARGNAYGCQFHPEKSGKRGLAIISNFLEL